MWRICKGVGDVTFTSRNMHARRNHRGDGHSRGDVRPRPGTRGQGAAGGRGQAAPEPPSAMANPYRMVENWPHFGDIKSGAAIGIIPDGKGGTWLHHRSEPPSPRASVAEMLVDQGCAGDGVRIDVLLARADDGAARELNCSSASTALERGGYRTGNLPKPGDDPKARPDTEEAHEVSTSE